ncbi:hypothetical protein [Enterobacter kobei]|nr:hypothetical protein [Enterobacter kobei]
MNGKAGTLAPAFNYICGNIQFIFLQVLAKEMIDTIRVEKPYKVRAKSILIESMIILSLMNIATKGKIHANIKVTPVDNKLRMILGSILFCFRAKIIPSVLELAELNIEIAANTKPNKIPATVDNTPAVLKISECPIGARYLPSNQANSPLITMLIKILISIIIIHKNETKSHIASSIDYVQF